MKLMHNIWDKTKVYAKTLYNKVNGMLNTAFPDVFIKRVVVVTFISVELLIAYLIAVLDIGIWIKDCSLFGMIAGYWNNQQIYPFLLLLLIDGGLAVFLYFYIDNYLNGNTGRGFTIADSNVYGSARDINMDELLQVADVKPKEAAMGMILGQLDETETKLITSKDLPNFNKNCICLAPPGSGKTATIVLNAIIQAIRRGESVITTDTKGEIWATTVELARLHGYVIRRFDLKSPEFSDGWDVLSEIRHSVSRASTVAKIIMSNTGMEKDPHLGAEESLLRAICLYQCLEPTIPEEEKTLPNAYSMLFQGRDELDLLFNTIQDDPVMQPAYKYYKAALQGSPNLSTNVLANLTNRLSQLADPAIAELTSIPDIDLSLPGKKKCIYYVELNDQVDDVRFLSSLFFSFAFLDLCDLADNRDDQVLPVPVNVMIEEMYACGYLPTVTNALSTVRSRGISVTMIAQGIDQFKILYGQEMTNVILDCCATYACLGANSKTTSELFEWLGGNATVDVKTEQHKLFESPLPFGKKYSTGYGRQALYTSNDVRKIKFQHILLVWQRFDPIMAHTFYYKRHPEYMKGHMPQVSGRTSVPLADREARAKLRAKEEERIKKYEDWINEGGNPWEGYIEPVHRGPRNNTPMPEIMSYPELEKMVLKHGAQVRGEKEADLMEQILQIQDTPAPAGMEQSIFPESFSDNDSDENDFDEDNTLDFTNVYPTNAPQAQLNNSNTAFKSSAPGTEPTDGSAMQPTQPAQPAVSATPASAETKVSDTAKSNEHEVKPGDTPSKEVTTAPTTASSSYNDKKEAPAPTGKQAANPSNNRTTKQSSIVLDNPPGKSKDLNPNSTQTGTVLPDISNYDDIDQHRIDPFINMSKKTKK